MQTPPPNPIWTPETGSPQTFTLGALEEEFEVRLSPEDGAMLCALFSRSADSARDQVARIASDGSANFMERFYAGYAHKSIADCGSTTVFAERISALAAKAIEDSPMFSGQETSTRYISFDTAPVWEATGHPRAAEAIERCMRMYRDLKEPLFEHIARAHPRKEGEKEETWRQAVEARAFDVRRAFLPSGAATQVGWHGNLRQLADHLVLLRHHPLEEVRLIANRLWAALREQYPSSFPEDAAMLDVSGERAKGRIGAVEEYRALAARWTWGDFGLGTPCERFAVVKNSIDIGGLDDLGYALLAERPRGAGLPAGFGAYGTVTFEALVDFGSYRDLHRQRRGFWRMPVVTPRYGFEPWYVDSLPPDYQPAVNELACEVTRAWHEVSAEHGPVKSQHMVPMGFLVPWRYTCGLPQVLYFAELRATKTVHPTARRVAQEMARFVSQTWPWVALHADMDESDWSVKRGEQTIVAR